MGILGSILGRIFGSNNNDARDRERTAQRPQTPGRAAAPAPMPQVDVENVLEQMAAQKGGGGNWRTSIVDLLKLLDLDSSLDARKELAKELNVHAGAHGSPEQNIALSKAVWAELARNGGRVSDNLRAA